MNSQCSIVNHVWEIAQQAKLASQQLATLNGKLRQKAIQTMAVQLESIREELNEANKLDVEDAIRKGMADPLVKRLRIDDKVFQYMLSRLEKVSLLPDPLGKVLEGHTQPDGLVVQKITVPLGVIGIIYESRPNVTTDAASVCLKSGNAVILRGGSESLRTNTVLTHAMQKACQNSGLPENVIQIIRMPGHAAVDELLKMDDYVDVLIPRGGKPLIQEIAQGTNISVIKHYEGLCHLYIAEDADKEMAVQLAINSKCQRVEVCNALETLLIDGKIASQMLPMIVNAFEAQHVELRGCSSCCKLIPDMQKADENDWSTEYLAPILSVKIIDGVQHAIQHINQYGSGHTDTIVTQSMDRARTFVNGVDSASVLVNASTRLSGGGDYGMGAVVGISTDKIHARGPVGPNDLTSYKWIVYGDGHLRK